ncbi:hypothetical protein L5D93_25715 [Paenibacillus thiaminolyticus]|nr:hypothetical protein [Paenibacillus thiaminolyticus]
MRNWKSLSIVKMRADEVDESKIFWKNTISTDLSGAEGYAVLKNQKTCCYFFVSVHGNYINVSFLLNNLLFNASLIQAICKYIFEHWPTSHKIVLYLLQNDRYGCYLAKAAGFRQEVVFREHYRLKDKKVNCIVFSCFNTRQEMIVP